VTGTLDRVERTTQFTNFDVAAHLEVPVGTDPEQARRALEKAERTCLISNSLKGTIHLIPDIVVAREREVHA
jgi:organic hydroperoxide reductase OsmC/OhrA